MVQYDQDFHCLPQLSPILLMALSFVRRTPAHQQRRTSKTVTKPLRARIKAQRLEDGFVGLPVETMSPDSPLRRGVFAASGRFVAADRVPPVRGVFANRVFN